MIEIERIACDAKDSRDLEQYCDRSGSPCANCYLADWLITQYINNSPLIVGGDYRLDKSNPQRLAAVFPNGRTVSVTLGKFDGGLRKHWTDVLRRMVTLSPKVREN